MFPLDSPPTDKSAGPFDGRRIAIVGRLVGTSRREAATILRERNATLVRADDPGIDLVVIGAEESPLRFRDVMSAGLKQTVAERQLEVITETEFWQQLGYMEQESLVRQLYTPGMLADLVGVKLSVIRRWHRRGLIVPVREVHRLPFFDFQEVATARQLAQLLAAGATPNEIERELDQLSRYVPDVERPLAQLAVIVEGKQLLLRQGEGLIEPGGQRRFDFSPQLETSELLEPDDAESGEWISSDVGRAGVVSANAGEELNQGPSLTNVHQVPVDELLELALDYEDAGELAEAIDVYRNLLVLTGPSAEWSFRLAELLYRTGDVTAARERYYMTVELDEDYVEARANLGCVLAELGQLELALAAFEGALQCYADYPDVHYHLARTLDDVENRMEAESHWRRFLALAPSSPWADEARERLGLIGGEGDLPAEETR